MTHQTLRLTTQKRPNVWRALLFLLTTGACIALDVWLDRAAPDPLWLRCTVFLLVTVACAFSLSALLNALLCLFERTTVTLDDDTLCVYNLPPVPVEEIAALRLAPDNAAVKTDLYVETKDRTVRIRQRDVNVPVETLKEAVLRRLSKHLCRKSEDTDMNKSTMGRVKNEILIGGFNAVNEYYTVERDFELVHEGGVDFILLSYLHDEKSDFNIKMLEKYGVKAFIYDTVINGTDPRELTPEKVLELSEPYRHTPGFLGFGIIDEPSDETFPRLGREIDVIRAAIPDALFHINLLPWYAFNDTRIFNKHLKGFVNYCDINHVSTDTYPLWRDENGRCFTAKDFYLGLNCSAVVARDTGREHWQYIYSYSKTGERGMRVFTQNDLYFQAYSHLAFGACKFLYFCWDVTGYKGIPLDGPEIPYTMRNYKRDTTELFDYAKKLNAKLHALSPVFCRYTWKHTEAVFCPGKNEDFLKELAPYTDDRMTDISTDVGLCLGSFDETDGNGFAFVMTNASEISESIDAHVSFRVPAAKTLTLHIDERDEVLKPDKNGVYSLTLKPGMGALLTATV